MSEFSGKYGPKKKTPMKIFYPVIGLLVAAISAAVAYFGSEPALAFIQQNIPQFQGDYDTLRLIVAVAIFFVLVMVFGMAFAMTQPKMPKGVSEKDLDREKQLKAKEEAEAKRRKKEMVQKMRQRNRQANR